MQGLKEEKAASLSAWVTERTDRAEGLLKLTQLREEKG